MASTELQSFRKTKKQTEIALGVVGANALVGIYLAAFLPAFASILGIYELIIFIAMAVAGLRYYRHEKQLGKHLGIENVLMNRDEFVLRTQLLENNITTPQEMKEKDRAEIQAKNDITDLQVSLGRVNENVEERKLIRSELKLAHAEKTQIEKSKSAWKKLLGRKQTHAELCQETQAILEDAKPRSLSVQDAQNKWQQLESRHKKAKKESLLVGSMVAVPTMLMAILGVLPGAFLLPIVCFSAFLLCCMTTILQIDKIWSRDDYLHAGYCVPGLEPETQAYRDEKGRQVLVKELVRRKHFTPAQMHMYWAHHQALENQLQTLRDSLEIMDLSEEETKTINRKIAELSREKKEHALAWRGYKKLLLRPGSSVQDDPMQIVYKRQAHRELETHTPNKELTESSAKKSLSASQKDYI